jgi:hypothetical protein
MSTVVQVCHDPSASTLWLVRLAPRTILLLSLRSFPINSLTLTHTQTHTHCSRAIVYRLHARSAPIRNQDRCCAAVQAVIPPTCITSHGAQITWIDLSAKKIHNV